MWHADLSIRTPWLNALVLVYYEIITLYPKAAERQWEERQEQPVLGATPGNALQESWCECPNRASTVALRVGRGLKCRLAPREQCVEMFEGLVSAPPYWLSQEQTRAIFGGRISRPASSIVSRAIENRVNPVQNEFDRPVSGNEVTSPKSITFRSAISPCAHLRQQIFRWPVVGD